LGGLNEREIAEALSENSGYLPFAEKATIITVKAHHHHLKLKVSDTKRVIQRHRDVNGATLYRSMSYA